MDAAEPASEEKQKRKQKPTDAVGKALHLLTLLGTYPQGVGVSALARQAGLPVTTAYRLLSSLVRDTYAEFDSQTKQYRLGLRVYQLARVTAGAHGFGGLSRPSLEQISEATHEATLMSVRDGHHQLYVQHIPGPQRVTVSGNPGTHGPLHCTSMGKVLIAFATDAEREALITELELPAAGPNSITDRGAFRAEIDKVRSQGFAIADEEHEVGIRAVGVPIICDGRLIASISAAAPAYRVTLEKLRSYVPLLHEAAEELSTMLSLA